MTGENLDISSEGDGGPSPSARDLSRRFIGVTFACCDAYARIYPNAEETAYHGHCPRCGKSVHARIGPGGMSERFFTVW